MPDNAPYFAFLRDPDQEQRRAELAAFFGPHADVFLKTYDRLRNDTVNSPTGKPRFRLLGSYGFEAAAFFLGPVWFFYRKMWAVAWVVVAILVAVAFIPIAGRASLVLSLLLGFMAHRTYVQHAITKLGKMRLADGTLDPAALQAEGGVSKRAGTISGVLFGIVWIAGFASILYLVMHGVDPR